MAYPTFTLDPYALTSLGSVKEHLGISDSDPSQDNLLVRFINASTEMIEREIDRKILARTYTEFYDGRANNRMLLSNWPIISISELWDDPSGEFTNLNYKLSGSLYSIDGTNDLSVGVILKSPKKFSKASRSIKVVYLAGYSTIPYVIQEACISHVEYLYTVRSDRRLGVSSKSKNGETINFTGDIPDFVKAMIAPYQRIEVPLAYQEVKSF